MSSPNLPLITLRRGPWVADLFDPRPAPALLGARFVQGGWVTSLRREGRELTGRADRPWLAYDGIGLPETFESGLGWAQVGMGEEFLRPGAGRLIKESDDTGERHALARLSTVLDWEVEVEEDHAVFRTSDALKRSQGERIAYQLERTIRLTDDGLVSATVFTMTSATWQTLPISWYAHPFFPQTSFDQTAFALPPTAVVLPNMPYRRTYLPPGAVRGPDGLWRLEADGGRSVFGGLWGGRESLTAHLQGGGALRIEPGYPLDHVVLWASDIGASIEPKWSRTIANAERLAWDITYRWI